MFFLTKLEQFIQDLAITTLFSFLEFSINMDHTKILNIGCFSNRCKKILFVTRHHNLPHIYPDVLVKIHIVLWYP